MVFVAFQLMFAIITPALITGATADRMEVRRVRACSSALWSILVYAPVAHWVFTPGWLARSSRRRRSTSPAARSCTSTPAPPAWRWCSCSASAGAGRGEPMPPHNLPFDAARHRHPVVRLVRLQRRLGAGRQRPGRSGVREHHTRRRRRDARLAGRRAAARRQGHDARRGVGRGRRAGRDHAVRRLRRRACALDRHRRSSPASVCCLAISLEDQVRLRRLPRRRRRAPRRRHRSARCCSASSPTTAINPARRTTACSSAAAASLLGDQAASAVAARTLVSCLAFVVDLVIAKADRPVTIGACDVPARRRGERPRPRPSTPRRRTTSGRRLRRP